MIDWMRLAEILGSFVVGGIATYFAPWIAWPIEKRREIRGYMRELLKESRKELLDPRQYVDGTNSNVDDLDDQFVRDKLLGKPTYRSLEPHLSEDFKRRIREMTNPRVIYVRASGGRSPGPPPKLFSELSEEIGRIERKWHLV